MNNSTPFSRIVVPYYYADAVFDPAARRVRYLEFDHLVSRPAELSARSGGEVLLLRPLLADSDAEVVDPGTAGADDLALIDSVAWALAHPERLEWAPVLAIGFSGGIDRRLFDPRSGRLLEPDGAVDGPGHDRPERPSWMSNVVISVGEHLSDGLEFEAAVRGRTVLIVERSTGTGVSFENVGPDQMDAALERLAQALYDRLDIDGKTRAFAAGRFESILVYDDVPFLQTVFLAYATDLARDAVAEAEAVL